MTRPALATLFGALASLSLAVAVSAGLPACSEEGGTEGDAGLPSRDARAPGLDASPEIPDLRDAAHQPDADPEGDFDSGHAAGEDAAAVVEPDSGTAAGADTGTAEGADTGTAEGADTGTVEGADTGTAEGADTGTAEGADAGTAEGADAGTVEGADAGTVEGADAAGGSPDAGAATVIHDFWGNTQWPPFLTVDLGGAGRVYGQLWIPGSTEAAGPMPGVTAELGFGPPGSDPASWTWVPANFNVQVGNNDEFMADLVPAAAGLYDYGFRYSVAGATFEGHGAWLYARLNSDQWGKVSVREAGAALKVATQNLHCQYDDPVARLGAMAARWHALGIDAVALQEVCVEASTGVGNSAEYLAAQMTALTGRTWAWTWLETHLAGTPGIPEGLGVISAFPIVATDSLDLVSHELARKELLAVLGTPVGMAALAVTHLSYRDPEDAAARLQQAQEVLGFVDGWQNGPGKPSGTLLIVAGDFNDVPTSPPLLVFTNASPAFTDTWALLHPGEPGYSYPSGAATRRIDYILVRAASGAPIVVQGSTQELAQPYSGTSYASDHAGFTATLAVP